MSANEDTSPDDSRTPLLAFERFARSIAEFLLYSHREGFQLSVSALRARATRHFGGHDYLVCAIIREVIDDVAGWCDLPPTTLAQRILDSSALEELVAPFVEDDYWFLDDDALLDLRSAQARRVADAASLAAWLPPPQNGAEWLREARLISPSFATVVDLARWLDVSPEEFDAAMANRRYRLRVHAKPSGGTRLIEIPPESLRVLQRRVLHRLLDRISPHAAAHAYVRTRSAHTHAAQHVGREMVVRLDLRDFFPSIKGARVFLLFRSLGFAANIANVLTALCVASQSRASLRRALGAAHVAFFERFSANHLPQGAPTSPALANLCAHSLDVRLNALAESFNATYTRYADDLVFSGDEGIASEPREFVCLARAIVSDEGFQLNTEKTRIMRKSARQAFAGLVVNEKINLPRCDYDQLKAAVHRATLRSTSEEVSKLLGRIAWLRQNSPHRADKLRSKLISSLPNQSASPTAP
ncbi:MAG: RNA-directed DNA polymerase [Burkholderiales bacterium]|nr:MAG: RNA-directed DNA polymerase [Burkholderiales bacterium]TAG80945.1 MAG: RNA-directed DNA polymerase [Betaproteobacteria bacterium]